MRNGMLAPMPSELRPLVKTLGLRPSPHPVGTRTYEGRSGSASVVAATTGRGTAGAAEAARRMLDAGDVDHVIVVGIAGGIDDRLAIGDVIRPAIVIAGASGAEYRPHPADGQSHPAGEGSAITPDGAC